MPNTKFLESLEAEKFKKQKWPMFCGTPCIVDISIPLCNNIYYYTIVNISITPFNIIYYTIIDIIITPYNIIFYTIVDINLPPAILSIIYYFLPLY